MCIRTTIGAAETSRLPIQQIIFEFTENEEITEVAHVRNLVRYDKERGFLFAFQGYDFAKPVFRPLAELPSAAAFGA